jgi:hypothetical protein
VELEPSGEETPGPEKTAAAHGRVWGAPCRTRRRRRVRRGRQHGVGAGAGPRLQDRVECTIEAPTTCYATSNAGSRMKCAINQRNVKARSQ